MPVISECIQEQLNCEDHYFKQKLGADIRCTHCGVHIIDLIDGLYKTRAEILGKTGQLERENAELRKQLDALKNCSNCLYKTVWNKKCESCCDFNHWEMEDS